MDSALEIRRLRTALRDLVALSTIPAASVGGEPGAIAAGLVDVLVGSLHLDFVFVRLRDPDGGAGVELTRGEAWKAFPEWLQEHSSSAGQLARKEIVSALGAGERCRGIVIPIGVNCDGGLVAAASRRQEFPDDVEQLLLSLAANHAASAFQSACLLRQRKEAEEELRGARDQLERKVVERTAELRRLYRDLQERDAKIRRLVDSNIIGIVISDLDGLVTDANDAFLDMVGYNREDVASGNVRWTEMTPPAWQAASRRAVAQVRASGSCEPFEKEYFRKDGTRVRALVGVAALHEGGRAETVAFVLDLTERQRAESTLRKTQADLAHVARITTLGALTASIAHEVNQPLSGILTNANTSLRLLARDPPDVEGARETARRTIRDANRASDVIVRLRALFDNKRPASEPVDLNEATREVLVLLSNELQRGGVSVRTELRKDLPPAAGDRVQLQQVVLNLLLNASEAMSGVNDRPREIVVTTERDAGDRVMLSVRDCGLGLGSEDPERVFEAFYTTKPGGMGIGLSVSRSIIENFGGRLWAARNDGLGATFTFSIPCVSADEAVPNLEAAASGPHA